MSLLDTASLIVTPNGYKEGKLYSVIPSDGSGDMSVVRATTATRVSSAGLVELVPYNLLTYSNTFSNAAWTKTNTSVTSGQSGYDGSTNAWKLQATATNNCEVDQSFTESETKVFSIYAKAGNVNFVVISVFGAGFGWYNLSNGTLGSSGGTFVSRNIESVGNGWYRCSIVTNVAASGVAVYVADANNSIATTIGSNIFIQDSQLESGSVPTTYQKTETRLNIPRLDYSNGTCPSLLVEPQRTNLQTYSEDFSNAVYIKVGATVSTNADVSPNGNTTADRLTEDTSTGIHTAAVTASQATGGDYTFSVFVKANGRTKFQLAEGFSIGGNVNFDLSAVTATTTAPAKNGKIENYGNGWYKCSATWAFTGGATTVLYLNLLNGAGSASYAGDGTSGVILWGAQLELGSYSTSYIPTTSASVTRNADVISKTGISSLIGQTEGTLFLDLQYSNTTDIDMFLSIRPNASNKLEIFRDGGVIYAEVAASNPISIFSTKPIGSYKIAFAYKSGSTALYINGTLISQSTTTFTFSNTLADLYLNSRGGSSFIEAANFNSVALWKTRLTNTQLAQLTTI
jgi:hypothetical protein